MADEKLGISTEENKPPEVSVSPGTDNPPTQGQAVIPGMERPAHVSPQSRTPP